MAQLPKSSYLLALLLSSCSITHQLEDTYEQRFSKDVATIQELQSVELKNVLYILYHLQTKQGKEKATASLLYSAPQLRNNQTLYL